MVIVIRKKGRKGQERTEVNNKVLYKNQEVRLIDYTETTAMNQFCEIVLDETGKRGIVKVEDLQEIVEEEC